MHSSHWFSACIHGHLCLSVCGSGWCKREVPGVYLLGQAHESPSCKWKRHDPKHISHNSMYSEINKCPERGMKCLYCSVLHGNSLL